LISRHNVAGICGIAAVDLLLCMAVAVHVYHVGTGTV
jgi:hypothetical protein